VASPLFGVESARGVRLRLSDGRELIDGMSSWWAAIHGYANPRLVAAVQDQAERMSHVMFGGLTHEGAVRLCERLVAMAPAGLSRVFLSDSGSVAMEIAIKLALQYWQAEGATRRTRLLTVRGGYHGDTFGAMAVCDPVTGMHGLFRDVMPEHLFAPKPECRFAEPCTELDVLLVADEIATGFGRSGELFACDHAGVSPDVMAVGKALTGGMLSMAATLVNDRVADALGRGDPGVFMHGPTFMGNPLACAAALASLDELAAGPWRERVKALEAQLRSELEPCRELPQVKDVRALGAIGVVELHEPVDMSVVQPAFVETGVWIRPFGELVYTMPPYITEAEDVTRITTAMHHVVREHCAA
jgi:adenosylmethionine-8-amino-7-oxononanoate aminotransferase